MASTFGSGRLKRLKLRSAAEDERMVILEVLGAVSSDPNPSIFGVEALATNALLAAIPPKLTMEVACRRLLVALYRRNKRSFEKMLREGAELVGLFLSRTPPWLTSNTALKQVISGVGGPAGALRDLADDIDKRGTGVVVRYSDPGSSDPDLCCKHCSTPNLLAATLDAHRKADEAWVAVAFVEK